MLWLPVAALAVNKRHWLLTGGFIAACILSLRLQIEMMESFNYPHGILGLMDAPLFQRGLITYGVIIALFLLLAHFSPRTRPIVFMSAALSVYIIAFCISTIIMAL